MSLFNKKKDYCSGVPDLEFGHCCKKHDEAYLKGGNRHNRKEADRIFKQCMKNTGQLRIIVRLYYLGVRHFGWLPFFWNGNGRMYKIYNKLSRKEVEK